MFEHSVKVPRHYKIAANIFKKVSTEGGSVKTLLYDEKLRHFRTNVLYALVTETIKHAADIEKIFETCGVLVNEPRLDPWLAKILTAELLFGKKTLPGKSKPEQTILSYKEQFEKCTLEDDMISKVVRRPRYVRINTNLLTTSDAIRAFQDEGYKFLRCTSGSYDDYLKQVQSLTEYEFTQDYHIKTMFVFPPGTKLHEHDLYLENQIILQDKATALAVHLLAPPPDSVVLDMCAAPGMKTTQLAAYLRNQGKIYAVERNEQRYQTLCDFVEKTGSKCVQTFNKDSLEIKRGDFEDVEYIILDPSCTGSGMEHSVHNYTEDSRLAKLTSLQEKFLKHAMNSFPNAKRIVYSTCSILPEENERVITNVVKTSRAKWRVLDVNELLKGQWNNFGSGMYGSMGTRCLYAKPASDFTTGFFLAVLDREHRDTNKSQGGENGEKSELKENLTEKVVKDECMDKDETELTIVKSETKRKSKKKNQNNSETVDGVDEIVNNEVLTEEHVEDTSSKKKKKKRKKDKSDDEPKIGNENLNDESMNVVDNQEPPEPKKKKKKKDKHLKDDNHLYTDNTLNEDNEVLKTKKKKRKKNEVQEDTNIEMCEDNTSEVAVNVLSDTDKKRKNKSKHENNMELIDSCDLPKKKKKKSKEVSLES